MGQKLKEQMNKQIVTDEWVLDADGMAVVGVVSMTPLWSINLVVRCASFTLHRRAAGLSSARQDIN